MVYDCKQLRNSRTGIPLSRQQLYELDCLLTPLIQRGQSIAHIYAVHKEEIPCSIKTIYNYIDQGIFTARNNDLPKKVKYKPRKKRRQHPITDYLYRKNRTYKDFQRYTSEHPDMNIVELDTVHCSSKKAKYC
jgi:IS30 family transposase